MGLTLVDGPNLSGRSEALKGFAWTGDNTDGQYLHPNPLANFSGLARTVAGERFIHGIALRGANSPATTAGLQGLAADLPDDQPLISLSGGQQVRLALEVAMATSPERLAIDTLLEQLDPAAREDLLAQLAGLNASCHVCDNSPGDIRPLATTIYQCTPPPDRVDLNRHLSEFASSIDTIKVIAPTIAVDDLSLSYGRVSVFRRASFKFGPGHPYLLKAPNGSGKTSLARILVGSVRASAGSIAVDGNPHAPWRSDRNVLAYAFQNPFDQVFGNAVRAYLDALEAAADRRVGSLPRSDWNLAKNVWRGFGLETWLEHEPFDLPPFVAKRLTIAAAIVSRSPWIFFDEPALWTDQSGRSALRKLFNALARAGFGVIIVSHQDDFDALENAIALTIASGRLEIGGVHG